MAGLTLRDRSLIDAAANGATPLEMEAKFGIPAAQAAMRVREILSTWDVFDEIERRKLLMHSLYQVKGKLETENFDIHDPKMLDAYGRLVLGIGQLLEKYGQISDEELEKVSQAQATALMELITAGYMKARAWLAAEYGDKVPVERLDEVFELGMREVSNSE